MHDLWSKSLILVRKVSTFSRDSQLEFNKHILFNGLNKTPQLFVYRLNNIYICIVIYQ